MNNAKAEAPCKISKADRKKVVFISGPITGVPRYWEAFERAEDMLNGLGYIALTPSRLPTGMDNSQYMRICLAMIDSADAVLFLPGWDHSEGSRLEKRYCENTDKPHLPFKNHDGLQTFPDEVICAWLGHDLKEVLN